MQDRTRIEEILTANGHQLPPELVDRLLAYEAALLAWNENVNLTSRRDAGEFFFRHIIGSISFLFSHSLSPGSTILDAGTGGGIPGIPLAILYPETRVTMVDSIQKKVKAVSDMIEKLGLKNARAVCSRVEELKAQKEYLGKFDYVVARAVARSIEVVGWCAPLVRRPGRQTRPGAQTPAGGGGSHAQIAADGSNMPGRTPIPTGSLLLLKGGNLDEEVEELRRAGLRNISIFDVPVRGLEEMIQEKKMIIVGMP